MAVERFSFDTSAFVEAWSRRYPIKMFAPLWQALDSLAKDGIVFASEEVLKEIDKTDDELKVWVAERPFIFKALTEDVQREVSNILAKHPRLVNSNKNRSMADPWVVAHAIVERATVVTEENTIKGKRPKIPEVCADMKIPCINILEFMERLKMEFK